VYRVIKVCHTNEQVEDELTTIVDLGGSVANVMVNHRVYGMLDAPLEIKNRRDVAKFVNDLKTGKSTSLLNVTSGYHFHKISAESEEILDEIEEALRQKNYLAELLPYEMV
ncbi:MAG: DNA-binding transcriptional regulator, partial [Roseburia sp.]|nr:DNA-binding transcriptional regulator [Roseburia sp.]